MIEYFKNMFLKNCKHALVKKTNRKLIEYKCDCCNKIIHHSETNNFVIEENISKIEELQGEIESITEVCLKHNTFQCGECYEDSKNE